ncbi:calcium/sodium antiporter [Legionella sp. km772]|uniref:calcium/sodium antiporter n=1 Tax=Legionella sp. km772 TaxID=2498111 RepID=UPI000F8D2B36|nr:calcium/sodium antiporter [Legionella sp. km772]RUR11970.1 calcium/sodium antiporter [Legionella sp. km772]
MHTLLILFISIIAMLWAANHLVLGASDLAHRFKLPPLIVGLTIVALGTSLPELFFSIMDSFKDEDNLILGNSIGSNIANIGLVLGITIILKPSALNFNSLKKTYPILIIAMLFVYSLILDGYLSHIDGCLMLLGCLIIISAFIYIAHHTKPQDPIVDQFKSAMVTTRSLKTNITNIILGLVILPICAKYIVLTTTELVSWMHINELALGLTIQAIGTTLPELSTAILAAIKGEEDLAVGTILGSNIYNLLLILAFPALINPSKINAIILWRDMPIMIFLALFLVFLNYNYKKSLSPWHGGVLIIIYCCYVISLIIKA